MKFNINNIKINKTKWSESTDCVLGVFEDKPLGRLFVVNEGSCFYVTNFEVFIRYRNKGIGTKILRFVKEHYISKNVHLGVEKENDMAFEFYKKEGFKIIEDCGYYYLMEFRQKPIN